MKKNKSFLCWGWKNPKPSEAIDYIGFSRSQWDRGGKPDVAFCKIPKLTSRESEVIEDILNDALYREITRKKGKEE